MDPSTRVVRDETAELAQDRSFKSPSRGYALSRSPPTRLDMRMLDELGSAGAKGRRQSSNSVSRKRSKESCKSAQRKSRPRSQSRSSMDAVGQNVAQKLLRQWARESANLDQIDTFGVKGKLALERSLQQELPPQMVPTKQPRKVSPSPTMPLRNRSSSATQRSRSRNGQLSARNRRGGKGKHSSSRFASGNALAPKDRRNTDMHLSKQSLNTKKILHRVYTLVN